MDASFHVLVVNIGRAVWGAASCRAEEQVEKERKFHFISTYLPRAPHVVDCYKLLRGVAASLCARTAVLHVLILHKRTALFKCALNRSSFGNSVNSVLCVCL